MPHAARSGFSLSGLWRSLGSIALALVVATLIWFVPRYDPISAMTPQYAALYCCGAGVVLVTYLFWQGWPAMSGEVESRLSRSADTGLSVMPALAALSGFATHMMALQKLSFTVLLIAGAVMVTALFDVIVFGRIENAIADLADDHGSATPAPAAGGGHHTP